ncbi:MAG: ATP-binding cassette domain-containing protein [Deltaproteobacteria bacterium]|jgi:phospholipid/cholesterol/gamma-HCH transport system ATP-binding protein|nr:ATP-binding cassette domain-containing protein [Deltaproteobacteria bacterium]
MNAAPEIKVQGVSKSFGGAKVLDDVSLNFLPGRVNFIIGRSGEGKSVLMKIMTGLYAPDAGSVFYGDLDLTRAAERQINKLRLRMGVLFQDGALFDSMTVGQNVVFPLWVHRRGKKAEAEARARALLSELGLSDFFDLTVAALSTGERKRVALARALMVDPQVVFFDEPTTGLDPLLSTQVDELIIHAQKKTGATVIVVSHDMAATLSLADSIFLLHNGKIILSGAPSEFKASRNPEVVRFLSGGDSLKDAEG